MNGTEIVASTNDAAFAVDLEGRILAWNQAAESLLGYRRSEVLGRRCWQVLEGRDPSTNRYCCAGCAVRDMARRGEPIHHTQVVVRNVVGEMTPIGMSTLVMSGTADQEVVHLLQPVSQHEKETGLPWPGTGANANARLSPRQLEVLRHLGKGRRTQEIAELLCISPATARHHIQHILARLKVHSRLEAVIRARRIGLL